ncbi:FHA domain-containing protein [Nostoc sp. FACHB-152]|uniref:FHA domain-containing protein n=1 Tax=unclassified Nostoc TaxID=2593658 RepID=UPI001684F7B3|nr:MULTISPECIES: FHA domain-containing protein [unclassified Nostoc]MBD2449371.1 FHA domain-containing protein [Nostoc sp. FACHB-152]MBD2470714.1 FHA domain-containing protein [Nostoc sp. FACHB-145]
MQNVTQSSTTRLSLELFHVQTSTAFELPPNLVAIRIGKPNDQNLPEIDVSNLPDAEIVSRSHAQIQVDGSNYFLEDLGSSNGTFLNDTKLEPGITYQLNVGDRIDLGQGNKVTFIFQNQLPNLLAGSNVTAIQQQIPEQNKPTVVDKTTKLVGLALMVASTVILTANIRIGLFFRIPGVALCVIGVFVLCQQRINRNLGWILIALGILVMIFTGNIFASVNLLLLLGTFVLFVAGYLLFTTGKIFGYDLRSLQQLINR